MSPSDGTDRLAPWETRAAVLTLRANQLEDTAEDDRLPLTALARFTLRAVARTLRVAAADIMRRRAL